MPVYDNWETMPQETTAADDFIWRFRVTDNQDNVVNITGYEFAFYAVNQADALDIITITNGSFTITDASEGQAQFTVAASDTSDYIAMGAVFQGEIWRANSGANKRLCSGVWRVNPTIKP